MVDTGDRKIPSVHIQLLKKYNRSEDVSKVNRATSVIEPDEEGDDIIDRYAEVKIKSDELDEGR